MRIVIGAPANGAALKDEVKARLEADDRVNEVLDLSTPEITYPQVPFPAAQAIVEHRADRGILIWGQASGPRSLRTRWRVCELRRLTMW